MTTSDPYHSYLALAALAMNENDSNTNETATRQSGDVDEPPAAGHDQDPCASKLTPIPTIGLRALDPLWNVSTETRTYIEECLEGIRRRKYASPDKL
jgi:hypothetical protein